MADISKSIGIPIVYIESVQSRNDDISFAFEWKKIGQLPQAAAYGVTISTEKGLICVGGTTATHSLSDVFLLSLQKDTLKRETLPSLPVTMDNMAGALVGHSLYIVGGNVNGIPSSAMYMLDLSDLSGGWKRETDIPGEPRVQPVCVAMCMASS